MSERAQEEDHGIQSAYYNNGPCGLSPTLECLCGFVASEPTWEDAGAELDHHLAHLADGQP